MGHIKDVFKDIFAASDRELVEEGKTIAHALMRKGITYPADVVLSLTHVTANKIYRVCQSLGAEDVGGGWCALVANRAGLASLLPSLRETEPVRVDQLPVLISAGAHHCVIGVSHEDAISSSGGES